MHTFYHSLPFSFFKVILAPWAQWTERFSIPGQRGRWWVVVSSTRLIVSFPTLGWCRSSLLCVEAPPPEIQRNKRPHFLFGWSIIGPTGCANWFLCFVFLVLLFRRSCRAQHFCWSELEFLPWSRSLCHALQSTGPLQPLPPLGFSEL